MEQCLGLDINRGRWIVLVGVQFDAGEKELRERVTGDLSPPSAGVVEHPVKLLGCAVVARMTRVAELVGVAVQGPRRGESLVRPSTVDHVHQVGLDPPLNEIAVIAKTDEQLRVLHVLACEVRYGELVLSRRPPSAVSPEAQAGE